MLWGYRVAPAIFLAAFIVNYLTAGSLFTSATIALGNMLEAVATAYFARRWAEGDRAGVVANRSSGDQKLSV
jgi:uncharacterized membrane protein